MAHKTQSFATVSQKYATLFHKTV